MAENKRIKKGNNKKGKHKKTQISKENQKYLKKVKKVKFKHKHPKIALILKIILLLLLVLIVVGAGIVIGFVNGAFGDDFEITREELMIKNSNSFIVDQEGNIIAELSGEENRKIITLNEMSEHLVDAYISIEDERFYKHKGVDLYRTAGAIVTYVMNGGESSFGGSTITQQLVKNITQDSEDDGIAGILRKVKEWAKAYQVEKMITKPQILELYLNIIPVGGEQYGVETGAKYYFNKSASELSLVECAYLAGINSAPSTYNPYGQYGYGKYEKKTTRINKKVKVVLSKMLELEKISQEEYDVAVKQVDEQGLTFKNGLESKTYSYHTDALLNQVINDIATEKNISKALAEKYIISNGLTIYSTQVNSIQQKTEEAVNNALILKSEYEDNNGNKVEQSSQAAMVVIDHKTGYVVGCIGGIGEKTGRSLNRATQSKRQPGSSIKPIAVVAPALEEKIITSGTIYNDAYTKFKVVTGIYDPKNWNYYRGNITVRQAIETSQNVPFVKIMTELGVETSIDYLEKMGITSLNRQQEGLALSIGGVYEGISPLEMAAAYATIANNGVYIEPTFYTKIVDMDENIVFTAKQESTRVISETTSSIVKNLLTEPVLGENGTATMCKISGIDVAAKTGTTNANKDRWMCGFTNYYTASVWYGFDQPAEIKSTGVRTANSIWATAVKSIHAGLENSKFTLTNDVITAKICKDSGKLASDTCNNTYSEIFEKGTIPESCDGHTGYEICNETKLLANQYCTSKSTIYKTYLVEKEMKATWETPENAQENQIPKEYCTTHKKVEVVEPEKPIEPEKPSEEEPEPEEPTENPEKEPTGEGDKPSDGDTSTGGNDETNTDSEGNDNITSQNR